MARRRGGGRQRRTWPQRVLIVVNALAVVAAAVTAGALAYSNDRVAQIKRNVFDEGVLATDDLAPGDAQNYLIVGVDDSAGLPEGDSAAREGGTALTDTIMVIRVDPATASASVLSFPRDLLVDIPGNTTRSRINSAFEVGGHDLLVRTIDANFAIPIHHYVQVDFNGFRELVEIVGGVPVQFPHPVRSEGGSDSGDPTVELDIPAAGCWLLGPRQALAFARVRKDFQAQDAEGDWHTDLGGDYSRVERQQLFIQLAMQQAISEGARNVNTLRRLVNLGVVSVTIDDGLEPDALVELSRSFRSFSPTDLVTYTLPVDEAAQGGPAYLYLREEEAEPTLARFRGGDPSLAPPVPAGDVTLQVRNGTGTPNQARDVTAAMGGAGFSTLVPGVDVPAGFPTLVQYAPGSEGRARVVASWVAGEVLYQPMPMDEGVDVILVTGQGWGGVRPAPAPFDEVAVPAPPPTDPAAPTTGPAVVEGSSTTAPGDDVTGGNVEDPDDPAFYRATVPAPGATCQPTP